MVESWKIRKKRVILRGRQFMTKTPLFYFESITVFGEDTWQKSNEQSIKCQNLLKHAFFYDAYAKSREVFLDFKDAILFRIQFCACLAEEDTYPVTVRRYGRLKMCPASSGHCDSSWQNSFPWFNPIVLSRPSCWCFSFGPSFKKWNKEAFRLQM